MAVLSRRSADCRSDTAAGTGNRFSPSASALTPPRTGPDRQLVVSRSSNRTESGFASGVYRRSDFRSLSSDRMPTFVKGLMSATWLRPDRVTRAAPASQRRHVGDFVAGMYMPKASRVSRAPDGSNLVVRHSRNCTRDISQGSHRRSCCSTGQRLQVLMSFRGRHTDFILERQLRS